MKIHISASRSALACALLAFVFSASAKETVKVKFKEQCNCVGCHAEYRWDAKTDEDEPPEDGGHPITPGEIGDWNGPGGVYTKDTHRKGREKKWYTVTGRVTLVKAEADGDLHIQLVDEGANDDDINVVVEVPAGEPWCEIRQEVFSWTTRTFPFTTTSGVKLTLTKHPVIEVTGKAFYDAIHGGGDTSLNRRPVPANAAATTKNVNIWEIHPVMKLNVISE